MVNKKTTIQINKNTLILLKKVKLTKRESYDEILNRLLEKYKGGEGDVL